MRITIPVAQKDVEAVRRLEELWIDAGHSWLHDRLIPHLLLDIGLRCPGVVPIDITDDLAEAVEIDLDDRMLALVVRCLLAYVQQFGRTLTNDECNAVFLRVMRESVGIATVLIKPRSRQLPTFLTRSPNLYIN